MWIVVTQLLSFWEQKLFESEESSLNEPFANRTKWRYGDNIHNVGVETPTYFFNLCKIYIIKIQLINNWII